MKAIFPGKCVTCGGTFVRGETIENTGQRGPRGGKQMAHLGCVGARSKRNPFPRHGGMAIPGDYPDADYAVGPDPQMANWTVYPEYSYEQFARANPGMSKVEEAKLRFEQFESALGSWNLKYDNFPSIDAWLDRHWPFSYGRDVAKATLAHRASRRSASYWGSSAMLGRADIKEYKSLQQRMRSVWADLEGDEYKGRLKPRARANPRARRNFWGGAKPAAAPVESAEVLALRDARKQVKLQLQGAPKNSDLWFKLSGDLNMVERRLEKLLSGAKWNPSAAAAHPVYQQMPDNAGPYLPQMFPYGSGGRPASYSTEPKAKAKKNPKRRRKSRKTRK